ncbi:hypothetical protein DFH09DRAFT_119891 [Mycena vulgaris]|nr:hypothetical protein DFH09DRAFT_119891 [Mycena vulgaris]
MLRDLAKSCISPGHQSRRCFRGPRWGRACAERWDSESCLESQSTVQPPVTIQSERLVASSSQHDSEAISDRLSEWFGDKRVPRAKDEIALGANWFLALGVKRARRAVKTTRSRHAVSSMSSGQCSLLGWKDLESLHRLYRRPTLFHPHFRALSPARDIHGRPRCSGRLQCEGQASACTAFPISPCCSPYQFSSRLFKLLFDLGTARSINYLSRTTISFRLPKWRTPLATGAPVPEELEIPLAGTNIYRYFSRRQPAYRSTGTRRDGEPAEGSGFD